MRGRDGKPIEFKFSSFFHPSLRFLKDTTVVMRRFQTIKNNFYLDKGRQIIFVLMYGLRTSVLKVWIKQYIGIFIVRWIRLIPLPRGITLIKGSSVAEDDPSLNRIERRGKKNSDLPRHHE